MWASDPLLLVDTDTLALSRARPSRRPGHGADGRLLNLRCVSPSRIVSLANPLAVRRMAHAWEHIRHGC